MKNLQKLKNFLKNLKTFMKNMQKLKNLLKKLKKLL